MVWEEMLADAYAEFQRYSDTFGPAAWAQEVQDEVWRVGDKTTEKKKINDLFTISEKDSEGRNLTKQQWEYFRKSKAVDSKGNLLRLYHGTPAAGFTEFNYVKYIERTDI